VVGQIESDGRAAARAEATGRRTFRVAVMDRGGGVPREVRRLLFVPFAARTGPQSGGSGGSGLGLATAAAGVRAHGGQIGYEDRRGGGAVFWFSLPVTHPRLVA
jgi:signal transduction histidine kinase